QWRKGYTSEAISKVLSYGFDVMDLTRIGAVVFIDNEASNNLLTKIGFQKEGVLKKYMHQNGEAHDTYVYSLLESNK
ncbi:MAG: GNAT family N-acetyltransferase, partial [Bacillota bacterium]